MLKKRSSNQIGKNFIYHTSTLALDAQKNLVKPKEIEIKEEAE